MESTILYLSKDLMVFIKIIRTGILILRLENKFFDKAYSINFRSSDFILANNNQEEIEEKLLKLSNQFAGPEI